MRQLNINAINHYINILREHEQEVRTLISAITIEYSFFFRGIPALEKLRDLAILPMLKNRANNANSPIRAWCAGCAAGEEAYTLAILFFEASRGLLDKRHLTIFATDLDESSLIKARQACYSEESLAKMAPRMIERYFLRKNGKYLLKEFIRQFVCIGNHNILKNAPISHLNLVSCRNVLIYFDKKAQLEAVKRFHYAIEPGGYLFLGRSETILGFEKNGFELISQEARIYRKIPVENQKQIWEKTITDRRDV